MTAISSRADPVALSRRAEFWQGVRDTFPMILGALPFGIIFGALGVNSGLTPLAVMSLSLFVFAGSSQFIAVGLLAQGVGIAFIVLTTFIVNLRHMLYAASIAPYLKQLGQRWLVPLAFWLTDETYAIVIRRFPQTPAAPYRHWYQLGSSVAMYLNWQMCTLVGIIAGTQLEGLANLGLDFAMVVTFLGIVVPLIVTRPMLLCALAAGITAALTNHWPNKSGLMAAALVGIVAGLIAEVIFKPAASPERDALAQINEINEIKEGRA